MGETLHGVPLRHRSIALVLSAEESALWSEALEVKLNLCGVSTDFWDIGMQELSDSITVSLFLTADYLEAGLERLR